MKPYVDRHPPPVVVSSEVFEKFFGELHRLAYREVYRREREHYPEHVDIGGEA